MERAAVDEYGMKGLPLLARLPSRSWAHGGLSQHVTHPGRGNALCVCMLEIDWSGTAKQQGRRRKDVEQKHERAPIHPLPPHATAIMVVGEPIINRAALLLAPVPRAVRVASYR